MRRLQLFLPDELATDLDALARRELRTMRSQAVYMLRLSVDQEREDDHPKNSRVEVAGVSDRPTFRRTSC